MSKRPDSVSLPPLTPAEISDRDFQERIFGNQLFACWHGDYFDKERVLDVNRAYSVEIFKAIFAAYQKKRGYEASWIAAITNEAIYRSLVVLNRQVDSEFGDLQAVVHVLEDAIADHLKSLEGIETQASVEAENTESTPIQHKKALDRRVLGDAYRRAFPDVKIADICWAAAQTRREWKRWITGEAKEDSKPDRSFRHVLTSGKKPEEIVGKPRPTKYST